MSQSYKHIDVQRYDDIFCLKLRKHKLQELDIHELGDELHNVIAVDGCRKMVLDLGPKVLECLYSVFLAKLVTLRRRLLEVGGGLKICGASTEVIGVFEACQLKSYFEFCPDQATAIKAFQTATP